LKRPQVDTGGFTLTEVLVALGLATLFLGVILQSASRDTLAVSRTPARYQALLRASQVLEYRMEEDRQGDDPRGSAGEKFPYDLSTRPVVADPRVEQVEVAVGAGNGRRESVSAYRLRVRRPKSKPKEPAAPTPSPSPDANSPPPPVDSGDSQAQERPPQ